MALIPHIVYINYACHVAVLCLRGGFMSVTTTKQRINALEKIDDKWRIYKRVLLIIIN